MSDDQGVERIRQEIAENSVVLFMKGTPVSPQCGFSAAVVDILSDIGVKWTHRGKVEASYTVCIAFASNLTGLVKANVECRRSGL